MAQGRRRQPRPRRRGYVLLLTLLLLAVAATAAGHVGLLSLRQALQAGEAQQQLQVRWGLRSCQQVLLPKAEQILSAAEERSGEPLVSSRLQLQLGEQRFTLVLSDEQAKLNVNTLYQRHGAGQPVQRIVQQLTVAAGGNLPVNLMPLAQADGQKRPFASFGQVFPTASPDELVGDEQREQQQASSSPTGLVSCWGAGPVNVHRAPRSVLEQACRPVLDLGQVDQLVALRQQYPQMGLSRLLDGLQLSEAKRKAVAPLLTDRSTCHSLWLVAHSGQRRWHRLVVHDSSLAGRGSVQCFQW